MTRKEPQVHDTSRRPDHGRGRLGQAAGGLLSGTDLLDLRPVLALLYNVAADPPGPPGYGVAPTDEEMWDLAPDVHAALELLTTLVRHARIPPFRVDRRRESRLDGIALAYRAMALDSRTAAGRAVLANEGEGYYRPGDVAASPSARSLLLVTAVDRDANRIILTKSRPGGPVEDALGAWQMQPGTTVQVGGALADGLAALLTALHERATRAAPSLGLP